MDEMIWIWHARLSLREAADVRCTDRRTGGEEKAAKVNANKGCLQLLTQQVEQTMRPASKVHLQWRQDDEGCPSTT